MSLPLMNSRYFNAVACIMITDRLKNSKNLRVDVYVVRSVRFKSNYSCERIKIGVDGARFTHIYPHIHKS